MPKHRANASIQPAYAVNPIKVYAAKPFRRPRIRAYIDPAINKAADNGASGFAGQMRAKRRQGVM